MFCTDWRDFHIFQATIFPNSLKNSSTSTIKNLPGWLSSGCWLFNDFAGWLPVTFCDNFIHLQVVEPMMKNAVAPSKVVNIELFQNLYSFVISAFGISAMFCSFASARFSAIGNHCRLCIIGINANVDLQGQRQFHSASAPLLIVLERQLFFAVFSSEKSFLLPPTLANSTIFSFSENEKQ